MPRPLPGLLVAAATLAFLTPARALAPTAPQVVGVYEGRMRIARGRGLTTRPFAGRLDIESQTGEQFTGHFSSMLSIANEKVEGTVSRTRTLLLTVYHQDDPTIDDPNPPRTNLMFLSARLNPRLNHLVGSWQDAASTTHGPVNFKRL